LFFELGYDKVLKKWIFPIFKIVEVIAKVRNLPFDKLRVNGLRLKSFTFSVRGELVEPQKDTFAIGSVVRRFCSIRL